ncbi:hypothetical protein [Shouchella patagoniensis]|uniref:hypothetical protein n=1 Tax=Shouchella patagoniensis TaxID=228576 RepID=UPI000994D6C5|nr:hypothetical protein [Shouchella patagoniensis]
MKKIVFLSLFICFSLAFYLSIMESKNQEIIDFTNLEIQTAHPFIIPETIPFSNPMELSSILEKVANDTNVNIIRGARYFRKDQTIEYIKYAWLTEESPMFEDILIKEGRLPKIKENNYIVTTKEVSYDLPQIGTIASLGQNFSILPLDKSFEVLPTSGRYFIEANDSKQINFFLETLSNEINDYLLKNQEDLNITPVDLQSESTFHQLDSDLLILNDLSELETIQYIILGSTLLLLVFYFYNTSKKIGVFVIHGYSFTEIWWELIGKTTLILSILVTLLSAILSIVLLLPTFIFGNFIAKLLFVLLVFIIFSAASLLFILKINTSQTIKHRKKYNGILIFNQLFKTVAIVLLLILSLESFSQIQLIGEKKEKLNNISESNSDWASLDDYAVYQSYLGYTTAFTFEELEMQLSKQDTALNALYPLFNEREAIYADTSEYEVEFQEINTQFSGIFSMTVNPNYLEEFPLQDEFDETIVVNEQDENWILIVPENFKREEKEIRDYFLDDKEYYLSSDREVTLEIIWLKKDQSVFSTNPEVAPNKQNQIDNPVIHVKTSGNELFTYRGGVRGNGLSDPLKIKLDAKSGASYLEELKEELLDLGLENNSDIVSIKDFLSSELASLKAEQRSNLLIFIALITTALYASVFNVIILVKSYAKKFAVYRLFGAGLFKTYRLVFMSTISCFIVSMILTIAAAQISGILPSPFFSFNNNPLVAVLIILVIIEFFVATLTLYIVEKKNVANTVKVDR